MSRLTTEITLDDIDDWFKIGKESTKKKSTVQSVPRSFTGGRDFNPLTGTVHGVQENGFPNHLPPYKRYISWKYVYAVYVCVIISLQTLKMRHLIDLSSTQNNIQHRVQTTDFGYLEFRKQTVGPNSLNDNTFAKSKQQQWWWEPIKSVC